MLPSGIKEGSRGGGKEKKRREKRLRGGTYTTRITPNHVMPGVVDPPRVGVPLELRLAQVAVVEGVNVLVVDDGAVRVVGAGAGGRVPVDVAAQAARVGAQAVGARVGGDAAHDGGLGAEGDDHAVELYVTLVSYVPFSGRDRSNKGREITEEIGREEIERGLTP